VFGEAVQIVHSLGEAKANPDRECSYVPCNSCGAGTPAFLFQDAEQAVGVGQADLVGEPLLDVESLLVLADGLVVVPAVLGKDAAWLWP